MPTDELLESVLRGLRYHGGECHTLSPEETALLLAEFDRLRAGRDALLAALTDLAIAADTAELMLRETHPGEAASLGGKVSAARAAIRQAT